MGDAFTPGPWSLHRNYRWMNLVAVAWVGLCAIVFCLPFTRPRLPFTRGFSWQAVNYAPPWSPAAPSWPSPSGGSSRQSTPFTGPARTVAAPEGAPVPAETAAEPPGPSLIADA